MERSSHLNGKLGRGWGMGALLAAMRDQRGKGRRRRLYGAALLTAGGLLTAACSGGSTAGSGSGGAQVNLTMFVWAGAGQTKLPKQVVDKYNAAHPNVNIKLVVSDNTTTYPKMVAAKRTTPDQNYVDFGFFNVSTFAQGQIDHMWSPLNYSEMPNANNVLSAFRPKNNLGIGYTDTTIGMLYNKQCFPTPPDSWQTLWSSDMSKKSVFFQGDWVPLELAAKIHGGSVDNTDDAFKLWSQRAGKIAALPTQNLQLRNVLLNGEACSAPWFYSISKQWINGSPSKLGWVNPKEGDVAFPSYLAMVTGLSDSQKAVVYDVLNQLLAAKNVAKYCKYTQDIPLEQAAVKYLPRAQRNNPNEQFSLAKHSIQLDWIREAKMNSEWTQRWKTEVVSGM